MTYKNGSPCPWADIYQFGVIFQGCFVRIFFELDCFLCLPSPTCPRVLYRPFHYSGGRGFHAVTVDQGLVYITFAVVPLAFTVNSVVDAHFQEPWQIPRL